MHLKTEEPEIVQARDPGSQFVQSQSHGVLRPAKHLLRLPDVAVEVIQGHLSLKRPAFRPGQLPGRVLERRNDFLRETFHHPLPGNGSPIRGHREAIRVESGCGAVAHGPVSTPRSSNWTGGFPASSSRTRTHAVAHTKLRFRPSRLVRPRVW